MTDIKNQIKKEIELRSHLNNSEKMCIKQVAKAAGISYTGLQKFLREPERGMSDKNLEKVSNVLNKRIVLIDK